MVYDPEFHIDNEILALVSDISVLADRIPVDDVPNRSIRLRRENRIRSIHSSLAIEGNTLSLKEVTDIINGKRVAGDPREILEVKGAIDAYSIIGKLDPCSVDDLLRMHGAMMASLVNNPGKFRECEVGVFAGSVPVHIAPRHENVPRLMEELMNWIRDTDMHPLLKGCIFHSRFEYIHPFVDGNGRTGRLWHSLILSHWKPIFSHIPIETLIKLNQDEYYLVLRVADSGDITTFTKFMLRNIKIALEDFINDMTVVDPVTRESEILKIISGSPNVTAAEMAEIMGVSERTVRRSLSSLVNAGKIRRVGSDKTGYWEIL